MGSSLLYRAAQRVDLSIGGVDPVSRVVNIEGKIYTVELISASDTSATIKVTDSNGASDTREVNEYASKKIQGLEIAVALADESVVNNTLTASLMVGAERLEFTHGTFVKAGSDENPLDGALLGLASGTTWKNASWVAIYFFAPDSAHDKISVGQTWANPVFNNLKLVFESYDNTNGAMIKIGGCAWDKSCVDSDGGNVPPTKGNLTYWVNNWTDYCNSASTLSEYYCVPNNPVVASYSCTYGCSNGACKPAPTGSGSCVYNKNLGAYVCS
ncbi:hypothetical protein HY212_06630 [Candidatus Pacearchaeota archaeon]|nr:hypothetical protein [Candidatus Pacearchaeota archaeon]